MDLSFGAKTKGFDWVLRRSDVKSVIVDFCGEGGF